MRQQQQVKYEYRHVWTQVYDTVEYCTSVIEYICVLLIYLLDAHRSQNPKIQNPEHKEVQNQGAKYTQHSRINKGHKKQRAVVHRATHLTIADKATERDAGGTIQGGTGSKSDPREKPSK